MFHRYVSYWWADTVLWGTLVIPGYNLPTGVFHLLYLLLYTLPTAAPISYVLPSICKNVRLTSGS